MEMVLSHMKTSSNLLRTRTIKIKTTQILFLIYQTGPNPKVLQHTFGKVVEKQAPWVSLGTIDILLCLIMQESIAFVLRGRM